MNFSPVQATHTEFTATNQTITIVETELDDYVVNDVTYVCESGATFPDMKITWANNTWTYRSTFDYAIPRKVSYYNIDKNDSSKQRNQSYLQSFAGKCIFERNKLESY